MDLLMVNVLLLKIPYRAVKICSLKMRTVPLLGTLLLWMASALFPMSKMAICPLCWRLRSWTFRLAYWKEDLFRRENMTTQTSGSGGASAPSHSTRVSFCEGGKVSFQFSLQMINSLSCFDNTNNFINPPPKRKNIQTKS